ncbi:hypothetical protein MPSEU_000643300 [Mayamaea pseudoterrestris]|nr:hypothetical protein MPSEU_000643300 [Mayamaea pseudoterrestris]
MHWAAQMLVDFDQDDFRLGAEEMAYRNKKRNDDAAADGKETHDTADSATATEAEAVAPSSPVYIPWTGTGRMLNYAFGLHLLAWYAQIHPGHFVMEGAKPALATSLGDALTTAPLFAFYEGLWFIGLRKEFQKEVLQLVKVKTRDLCRTGERMRICETVKWTEAMDERQDVNKMGMLLN